MSRPARPLGAPPARLLAALLAALVAGGCGTPPRYPDAATELERGLVLVERADDGVHALSAPAPPAPGEPPVATRVPRPAPVDLNSLIEVRVRPEVLARAGRDAPDAARLAALEEREAALRALLATYAEFLEERAAAIEAYDALLAARAGSEDARATALSAFDEARRAMAAVEGVLVEERVLAVWPEPDPADADAVAVFEAVDEAIGTFTRDPAFRDLVQAELDAVAAETEALLDATSYRLRLESFLRSPGKDPIAVHLEGYDELPQGTLERRDRWGLALEGAERERFDRLQKESVELARTGNRVRDGELSLEEAFRDLSGTVLGDLGALGAQAASLARELEGERLGALLERTRADAEALAADAAARLEQRAADEVQAVRTLAVEAADGLAETLRESDALAALLADVELLRATLDDFRPEDVGRLHDLLGRVAAGAKALGDGAVSEARAAAGGFEEALAARLRALPAALRATVEEAWTASLLRRDLETWSDLAARASALVEGLAALAELGEIAPIPADLRVPEAIDVPLEGAPDTFLELEQTPRLPGDRLTLRATLLDGDEPIGAAWEASLDVRRFGWHARLDPAVVLARPSRLEGADENYRFAPSLSWLHTYSPRPEADGPWPALFRATGIAVGPHATFLAFDPDKELEVGLGLTLALWNGVLQLGAGWNLHADDDDGGRYYFVGSSLIPLLQAFQND